MPHTNYHGDSTARIRHLLRNPQETFFRYELEQFNALSSEAQRGGLTLRGSRLLFLLALIAFCNFTYKFLNSDTPNNNNFLGTLISAFAMWYARALCQRNELSTEAFHREWRANTHTSTHESTTRPALQEETSAIQLSPRPY